jgi:hypothetical protein
MLFFADRVGGVGCILALTLCGAAACSGAAPSDLSDPPSGSGSGDGSSGHVSGKDASSSGKDKDATTGSGSGSSSGSSMEDATADDAAVDADDATSDDATGDDGPAGPACTPACSAVQMCCTKPGNAIAGRCYNPNLCFPFCC